MVGARVGDGSFASVSAEEPAPPQSPPKSHRCLYRGKRFAKLQPKPVAPEKLAPVQICVLGSEDEDKVVDLCVWVMRFWIFGSAFLDFKEQKRD